MHACHLRSENKTLQHHSLPLAFTAKKKIKNSNYSYISIKIHCSICLLQNCHCLQYRDSFHSRSAAEWEQSQSVAWSCLPKSDRSMHLISPGWLMSFWMKALESQSLQHERARNQGNTVTELKRSVNVLLKCNINIQILYELNLMVHLWSIRITVSLFQQGLLVEMTNVCILHT